MNSTFQNIDCLSESDNSPDFLNPVERRRKSPEKPNSAMALRSKRPLLKLNLKGMSKCRSKVTESSYKLSSNYEIIKTLGSGSYALVNLAVDKNTGSNVAIKISMRQNSREKLRNEYSILKNLDHQSIVKPLRFIENDLKDESYLVLEYFEGVELSEYINQNGVLEEDDCKSVIKQLSSWVAYLHGEGVAHRDIKPENILINKNKEILLIDFNISKKKLIKDEAKCDEEMEFKSKFYTQISSPLYAAPELKNNAFYTESIDIWGVGIITFVWLFGNIKSFDSKLNSKCDNKIISEKIESETRREFKDFLFNILSEDPTLRPSAAAVVSHSLLS